MATAVLVTSQLSVQIGKIDLERVLSHPSQREQEIGTVQPGKRCGHLLGNLTLLIPGDRRGKVHLLGQLFRVIPHGGTHLIGVLYGYGRHGRVLCMFGKGFWQVYQAGEDTGALRNRNPKCVTILENL